LEQIYDIGVLTETTHQSPSSHAASEQEEDVTSFLHGAN